MGGWRQVAALGFSGKLRGHGSVPYHAVLPACTLAPVVWLSDVVPAALSCRGAVYCGELAVGSLDERCWCDK